MAHKVRVKINLYKRNSYWVKNFATRWYHCFTEILLSSGWRITSDVRADTYQHEIYGFSWDVALHYDDEAIKQQLLTKYGTEKVYPNKNPKYYAQPIVLGKAMELANAWSGFNDPSKPNNLLIHFEDNHLHVMSCENILANGQPIPDGSVYFTVQKNTGGYALTKS